MARQTSVDAYKEIRDNGLLSERRWQVYDVLFHYGPLTGNEALKILVACYKIFAGNAPSIISRLGELRAMGVVMETKQRACTVTGMTVIEWDVTDKLPVKFDKPVKEKCKSCNGTGYIQTQQSNLGI